MNHTTNYNLSQWDAEDKVQRADFNADNAKIDGALAALAAKDASLQGLLNAKGNCRVETLTYTGKYTDFVNGASNTLRFSGRPAFVLILGSNGSILLAGPPALFIGKYDGLDTTTVITITSSWSGSALSLTYPVPAGRMDALGIKYQAIAWIPLS